MKFVVRRLIAGAVAVPVVGGAYFIVGATLNFFVAESGTLSITELYTNGVLVGVVAGIAVALSKQLNRLVNRVFDL